MFDIDNSVAVELRIALYRISDSEERKVCRKFALHLLRLTHERDQSYNETTFVNMLEGVNHDLSDDQQSLVMGLYLDASKAYKEWVADRTEGLNSRRPAKPVDYGVAGVHGGSGYTGRLKVGDSAPYGTESFQSDDDPRDGRKQWVKAVTAGGNGAGYSLGELSGATQRKEYGAILPPEELRSMSTHQLLGLMDTATNPGNFLRAMLVYYEQPMIFPLANVSINSGNINNPENRRTAIQLDSVYRFMKQIDEKSILTPIRATRFLVLCDDLLSKVYVKQHRRADERSRELYNDQSREVDAARNEIEYELKEASTRSGVTAEEMRQQIDSSKRARLKENRPVRPFSRGISLG